jgi:hypothetical protein
MLEEILAASIADKSSIVKYKYRDCGQKYYDIDQAIRDGGYPDPDDRKKWKNLKVRSRESKVEQVITGIEGNLADRYWVKFGKNHGLHLDLVINWYEVV